MKISIFTIKKTIYEGEGSRVTLPTAVGEVTVLDHHEPYVTILASGKLRYEVSGQKDEQHLKISGGFLEVRENNEVRILADD